MEGLSDQLETRISNRDGGSGSARDLQRTFGRGILPSSREILDAFQDIQTKCDIIHLPPSISKTAKQMFKKSKMDQRLRGVKKDAIIAASIYCSCKTHKVPRTIREICQLTSVSEAQIGSCLRRMRAIYGPNMTSTTEAVESTAVTSTDSANLPTAAVDLVGRFCNHLGMDATTTKCTEEIALLIRDGEILVGRSPTTMAAACIYMTSRLMGKEQSIANISRVTGTSEVTIKKSFKDLLGFANDVLTPTLLAKYPKLDVSKLFM